MSHDEKRHDYSIFAFWTMRDALEDPLPNSLDQKQHARTLCHLLAAAKLVEIIGDKIFQWSHEPRDGPQEDLGEGGPLFVEVGSLQRGFCRERWAFWRERFLELSGGAWLSKEYREVASKAVVAMSTIERKALHT